MPPNEHLVPPSARDTSTPYIEYNAGTMYIPALPNIRVDPAVAVFTRASEQRNAGSHSASLSRRSYVVQGVTYYDYSAVDPQASPAPQSYPYSNPSLGHSVWQQGSMMPYANHCQYQCEGGATCTCRSHGYRSPGSHLLGPTVPLFPVEHPEGFPPESSWLYPTSTQLAPFHSGYWPRARSEGGAYGSGHRTNMSMSMSMNMPSRHRHPRSASFTRYRSGNAGRFHGSGWTYTLEYKESHRPSVTSPDSVLVAQEPGTQASIDLNVASRSDREKIKRLIQTIDHPRSVVFAVTIRCPPNPEEETPPTIQEMSDNVHINDTEGRDVDKPRTRQLHVWRLANESPMHERETTDRSEIWYRTPWGAWEEVENWMLDRSDLSSQNRVLRIIAREVGQAPSL